MGGKGGGGSQSSTTVQSNEPPEWARPLLEKSAGEAMRLYDAGMGYNVYEGPTQANLSAPTLGGMNSLLASTGYRGAPVKNQTAEEQFPQLFKMFEEQKKKKDDFANQPPPGAGGGSGLTSGWHQVMGPDDVVNFQNMQSAFTQAPELAKRWDNIFKQAGAPSDYPYFSSYYTNAAPFTFGAMFPGQQVVYAPPPSGKQLPDYGNPFLRKR